MMNTSLTDEVVLKQNVLRRVKTPKARREQLLDEFEQSGLPGLKFAELAERFLIGERKTSSSCPAGLFRVAAMHALWLVSAYLPYLRRDQTGTEQPAGSHLTHARHRRRRTEGHQNIW
jgi:hypothetical protein